MDLWALPELTDSTLLEYLLQRYSQGQAHCWIGQVLVALGEPGTEVLTQLASQALGQLLTQQDDQVVLLYGCHDSEEELLSQQLLQVYMALLECSSVQRNAVLEGLKLLRLFVEGRDGQARGLVTTAIHCHPRRLEYTGLELSCVCLDTRHVTGFKAMQKEFALEVRDGLLQLGMSQMQYQQLSVVLGGVAEMCEGVRVVWGGCEVGGSPEAVGRMLYAHTVSWLVRWLNSTLGEGIKPHHCRLAILEAPGDWPSRRASAGTEPASLGGLDELLSSYTSEVLFGVYCTRMFAWEQEQYSEEGLEWESVTVDTNHKLLKAFEQPGGVLDAVSSASCHDDLLSALTQSCVGSRDVCSVSGSGRLLVQHCTGEMEYTLDTPSGSLLPVAVGDHLRALLTSGAVNALCEDVLKLALGSSCDVLLGNVETTPLPLVESARQSLALLADWITTSQPHFVLRVAPNNKQSGAVDREGVLRQLQQLLVVETALMHCCGYPTRMTFELFLQRFSPLCEGGEGGEGCEAVLRAAKLQNGRVGRTQVLLKPWHCSQLEALLTARHSAASTIQRCVRRFLAQRRKARAVISTVSTAAADSLHLIQAPRHMTPVATPPQAPPRPEHTMTDDKYLTILPGQSGPLQRGSPSPQGGSPQASPKGSPYVKRKKPSWGKCKVPGVLSPPTSPPATAGELLSQPWYHGNVSRDGAEVLLLEVRADCFLVRESEKRSGQFSLSVSHRGCVKHFRIDTKPGPTVRFGLYGAVRGFPSVQDLVGYYTEHNISSDGEILTTPCPRLGLSEATPPPLPPRRQSIRQKRHNPIGKATSMADMSRVRAPPPGPLSAEALAQLQRELDIEQRIVDAARRLAEIPSGSRRERQRRRESLQQSTARLLSLRQQFHLLNEKKRFIEVSMQNVPRINRRESAPMVAVHTTRLSPTPALPRRL